MAFRATSFEPPAENRGMGEYRTSARGVRYQISHRMDHEIPKAVLGATLVGAWVRLREGGRGGRGYDQAVTRDH